MDTANTKTSEDDNSPWINLRKTLREGWGGHPFPPCMLEGYLLWVQDEA